jgi:hypothetical protein
VAIDHQHRQQLHLAARKVVAVSPIRLVTADGTEAAAAATAKSLSSLAVHADAAAQAFENIDRLLRRHSTEPTKAGAGGPSPQQPVSAQQRAEAVHAPERSRFSMTGFLAGVALAAAMGVLVYMYLPLP